MQKVTKYLSDDGHLYDTEEEALFQDEIYKLSKLLEGSGVIYRDCSEEVAKFLLKTFTLIPKKK